MTPQPTERVTIDKVDRSKPLAEWKSLLADFGRRRHLSYTMDFDTRAHVFEEPGDGWAEEARRLHLENRERTKAGLAREFGADYLDEKVANFVAIGFKPFSVLASQPILRLGASRLRHRSVLSRARERVCAW
jgi:hypothetical protein